MLIHKIKKFQYAINKCEYIYNYNTKIIKKIQAFLCVILIVYIIFQIPNSIQKFYSGRNLSDLREDLYGTNEIQGFFIIGLIGRLFGATPLVLLCISCINLFCQIRVFGTLFFLKICDCFQ